MCTYFDGSVHEVDTVHIVEESEAVGNDPAVGGNGETVDLIGDEIVEGGNWAEECVDLGVKGTHIAGVGTIQYQKIIELII